MLLFVCTASRAHSMLKAAKVGFELVAGLVLSWPGINLVPVQQMLFRFMCCDVENIYIYFSVVVI